MVVVVVLEDVVVVVMVIVVCCDGLDGVVGIWSGVAWIVGLVSGV